MENMSHHRRTPILIHSTPYVSISTPEAGMNLLGQEGHGKGLSPVCVLR